jgi:hypothetical protein
MRTKQSWQKYLKTTNEKKNNCTKKKLSFVKSSDLLSILRRSLNV